MKTYKKLTSAIFALVIAALTLASASFAWFSISGKVVTKGMEVGVVAPNNLWISKEAPEVFGREWSGAVDFSLSTGISLIPSSSPDGLEFVKLFSDEASEYGGLIGEGTKLAVGNGDGAYRSYTDFLCYLRTDNYTDVEVYAESISVTPLDASAVIEPIRIALIYEVEGVEHSYVYNPGGTNAGGKVISSTGFPVMSLTSDMLVTPDYSVIGSNECLIPVAVSGEILVKVRIWFEGQDVLCDGSAANSAISVQIEFNTKYNV